MRIGLLGGGQLARMIALAGYPLGLEFIFLDPAPDACVSHLGQHLLGDYDDQQSLSELAGCADIVTYEFESVPAPVAEFLAAHTQVHPHPRALAIAQDRLLEKDFFNRLSIETPAYAAVSSIAELQSALAILGYPSILKSRTQGYDGKGKSMLRHTDDLAAAWQTLNGVPAIVEAFVHFNREVSVIAARSRSGETVFYPLAENVHRGGILRVSTCRNGDPMQAQAEDYSRRLLEALDYVGVLALELFEVDGKLIANECAQRVHNSGHWTIEGAQTSQFENHLRAILDWPLGSTAPIGHSAMVNFIGGLPDPKAVLALGAHWHCYGKAPRKGRKVAHATIRTDNGEQLVNVTRQLAELANSVDES